MKVCSIAAPATAEEAEAIQDALRPRLDLTGPGPRDPALVAATASTWRPPATTCWP
ncbi:hypothetical protein ACQP2K_25150 [Microbispora siamensis]